MRALDLFVEREAIDRSFDCRASLVLSKEVDDLSRRQFVFDVSLTPQDKVAIASASIMLGSPFLLFGLGATFAIFDECNFQSKSRNINGEASRAFGHRRLLKATKLKEDIEKSHATKWLPPASSISSDVLGQPIKKSKKISWQWREDLQAGREKSHERFALPAKSWLVASKLVKRKHMLLDQVERMNNGENYGDVSKLLSQIELLDKALKRMGC